MSYLLYVYACGMYLYRYFLPFVTFSGITKFFFQSKIEIVYFYVTWIRIYVCRHGKELKKKDRKDERHGSRHGLVTSLFLSCKRTGSVLLPCSPSLVHLLHQGLEPVGFADKERTTRRKERKEKMKGESFLLFFPRRRRKQCAPCYIGGFHPVLYPQQPVPPVSLSIIRQTVLFDWLVVVSYKVAVATSKEGVLLPVHFPGSRGQSAQHNRSRGEPTSNTPITPEEKL